MVLLSVSANNSSFIYSWIGQRRRWRGLRKNHASEYGEPVVLRCGWCRLEPADLPILSGLKALSSKLFHKVCSQVLRTVAGFRICYAAKYWYGDLVGMMIFGASEVSGDVDLGEETKTMVCKFVVRASSGKLVDEISVDVQTWLDDLTDDSVLEVSEKEAEAAAAEKRKRLLKTLAAIKANPPPQFKPELDADSEDD